MLHGIDIIPPEQINTNMKKRIAIIKSCETLEIGLSIKKKLRGNVQYVMQSKAKVIIGTHTINKFPIKTTLLMENRYFIFYPEYKTGLLAFQHDGSLYSHLVNSNMSFAQLHNDEDTKIVLPKHTRLGVIDKIEKKRCYMIEDNSHGLTAQKLSSIRMVQRQQATKLFNSLTIYGVSNSLQFKQLAQVCIAFPQVWVDQKKLVSISESEYLQIPLLID